MTVVSTKDDQAAARSQLASQAAAQRASQAAAQRASQAAAQRASQAAAQRALQAAAMPRGTGGVHTATKPMVANPHAAAERRAQHDVDRVAREHQRMMGREHRVHPDRGNGRGRGGRRG